MTEANDDGVRDARQARHRAIRAEVAQEESEAAQSEMMEKAAALDVPLHLRIDRELDAQLRRQAAEAHVPTLALVRRLLPQAVRAPREQLTEADVESMARASPVKSCTARRTRRGRGTGPQPGSQAASQLREFLRLPADGVERDHGHDLRV